MNMEDKNREAPNRIPVRFIDNEGRGGQEDAPETGDAGDLSPEELGRASIYEGETEMQRRIDRGAEDDKAGGRGRADDSDAAGGPDAADVPESRSDLDTTPPLADGEAGTGRDGGGEAGNESRQAGGSSGPMLAELVATRAELRRVETELQKVSEERQEWMEKVARRQADFENYRKRVERERGEAYNRVVGEVVGRLFPVMDNLQRALDAEASVEASESEEFRHFLHGIELISKQLNGVLEHLGVETVPTVGAPFDPHIHEAVATEETDRFEPDTVTAEMQRGYRLGDKLLRPAMVKVATKA
jgi:molecular chaperone GrpE